MPVDPERRARLYYDRSCGPCTFFAEAAEGMSRGRIDPVPLDGPGAGTDLGDLPTAERFGAAHVVVAGESRRTGPEIVRPLVGLAFGPTVAGVFERFPALDRPLRWLYRQFWEHRQRHGCATAAST
ncbi:MAG TPA: hypothetical protein VML94_05035 [Thermoplasmata archaeon]|nr:hypothetical protein [Thermoplasmata archaeon]